MLVVTEWLKWVGKSCDIRQIKAGPPETSACSGALSKTAMSSLEQFELVSVPHIPHKTVVRPLLDMTLLGHVTVATITWPYGHEVRAYLRWLSNSSSELRTNRKLPNSRKALPLYEAVPSMWSGWVHSPHRSANLLFFGCVELVPTPLGWKHGSHC